MSKKKILVLISIILLFLLYITIFSFYNKEHNSSSSSSLISSNEASSSITVDKVLKFIDEFKINYLDSYNNFFDDIKSINNQTKLSFVYYAIKDDIDFSLGVSHTKFISYLKNVFGNKITLKNEDIYFFNKKDVLVKYDISNEIFIREQDTNVEELYYSRYNYVINFTSDKDNYILMINKFFEKDNKVYASNSDLTNNINAIFDIPSEVQNKDDYIKNYVNNNYNKLENKLQKYQYVFTKQDGILVLKKYIKVK